MDEVEQISNVSRERKIVSTKRNVRDQKHYHRNEESL